MSPCFLSCLKTIALKQLLFNNSVCAHYCQVDCSYTIAQRQVRAMAIQLKVKEIAQSKGLSQRQVYLRSGLDIKIVQRVMRNPHENITLATLDRLAVALEVDPCELIEQIPDEEPGKEKG
jgi:DNA-binding Xre family transcriptional regulator